MDLEAELGPRDLLDVREVELVDQLAMEPDLGVDELGSQQQTAARTARRLSMRCWAAPHALLPIGGTG